MSTIDSPVWHRTSPLAAVFYLGKIYQALAKNALQSLAPVAAFLVAFHGSRLLELIIGVAVFILGTLAHAILCYWFFRYRIAPDAILIRDGVFNRKQLDIKFERIQGIDVTQNLIFRIFKLVSITFDTAGSARREGSLPAISVDFSNDLKDRIRRTPSRSGGTADVAETQLAGRIRTLTRLSTADVVRIGLSSSRVFLILVLLGPLSKYLGEQTPQWVEENELLRAFGAAQVGVGTEIAFGILIVLAIAFVLLSSSIIGALLRFFRYELVIDDDVLRSVGGLLTRHEHAVNRAKIQSVHVIQNIMLRLFGQFRIRARQATSGTSNETNRFDIPICSYDTVRDVCHEILQREFAGLTFDPRAATFQPISRYYLRSRILLFGVLPALLGLVVLWPAEGIAALLALVWIPLAAAVVFRTFRRYGVAISENGLAVRRGFIGYRVVLWLHRKVQRVSITQSPLQRRKQLATIRFHLAAGSVTIPFMDRAAASELRDYVLYRVESSQLAWH